MPLCPSTNLAVKPNVFFELSRQTGGHRIKASFNAVGDLDGKPFLGFFLVPHDGPPLL